MKIAGTTFTTFDLRWLPWTQWYSCGLPWQSSQIQLNDSQFHERILLFSGSHMISNNQILSSFLAGWISLLLGWEWRSFGQELQSRIIFCSRIRCLQIPNSHPPFCLYGIYVSKFWLVNLNCFPWAIRDKFLAFFSEVKRIYTHTTDPPPKRSASPDTLPNALPLAGLNWLWLRREHHWLRYSLSVSVTLTLIPVCGLQTCLIRQGGQNTSFFSVFEGVLYAKKAKRAIEAGNCPPYCILVWRTENGVLIWSDTVART